MNECHLYGANSKNAANAPCRILADCRYMFGEFEHSII